MSASEPRDDVDPGSPGERLFPSREDGATHVRRSPPKGHAAPEERLDEGSRLPQRLAPTEGWTQEQGRSDTIERLGGTGPLPRPVAPIQPVAVRLPAREVRFAIVTPVSTSLLSLAAWIVLGMAVGWSVGVTAVGTVLIVIAGALAAWSAATVELAAGPNWLEVRRGLRRRRVHIARLARVSLRVSPAGGLIVVRDRDGSEVVFRPAHVLSSTEMLARVQDMLTPAFLQAAQRSFYSEVARKEVLEVDPAALALLGVAVPEMRNSERDDIDDLDLDDLDNG